MQFPSTTEMTFQGANIEGLIGVIEDTWLQSGEDLRLNKIRHFTDMDPEATANFAELLTGGQ